MHQACIGSSTYGYVGSGTIFSNQCLGVHLGRHLACEKPQQVIPIHGSTADFSLLPKKMKQ